MKNTYEFVVVGSINLDILIKQDRFPREGETLQVPDASILSGGKGANQAVQIGKLGGDVTFCGAVDDGPIGSYLEKVLVENGVHTDNLLKKSGVSGLGIVNFLSSGQLTSTIVKGTNYRIEREDVSSWAPLICGAKYVVLQHEISEEITEYVFDIASQSNAKIVLNAAPIRPVSDTILKKIDYLVLNEVEAEFFLGHPITRAEDVEISGKKIAEINNLSLIVTLGPRGSVLVNNTGSFKIPPIPVDVVETTGAGDSYIGAFAYFLNQGKSEIEACRYATCASSLTIQAEGAQPSMPERKQVLSLYNRIYSVG